MKLVFSLIFTFAFALVQAKDVRNVGKQFKIDPRDLVTIDGKEYYVSPKSTYYTAVEALFLCNENNMAMVSLETAQKEQAIVTYLKNNGYGETYWSSGIRYNDGEWIWSNLGQKIKSYTNWNGLNPDQPNLLDACMHFDTINENGWWDDDCNRMYTHGAMCEHEV